MDTRYSLLIDNICKLYDGRHGIHSISAQIKAGEITAIIGPNGVGKTTLLKAIAGLLEVSQGNISLMGTDMTSRECKKNIGFMQENLSFYSDMTVYQVLDFICKIKYNGKFRDEIDMYLKKYQLFDYRNALVSTLSLGSQKKLAIIMALIGTPKLLLLDEPTNGVDTSGIIQFKNDLLRCAQEGCIVIVTSHVLDFLEKISSRCIFLKDGTIAEDIDMNKAGIGLEEVYAKIYCL